MAGDGSAMVTWRWLKSRSIRLMVSAAIALIGYGAWAYVANMGYGAEAGWRAAFTQGGYAFFITLLMTTLLETVYRWAQPLSHRGTIAFVVTCVLLYVGSWGVNAAAGTPRIFWTILPGMIIGTVYTANYILLLNRLQRL